MSVKEIYKPGDLVCIVDEFPQDCQVGISNEMKRRAGTVMTVRSRVDDKGYYFMEEDKNETRCNMRSYHSSGWVWHYRFIKGLASVTLPNDSSVCVGIPKNRIPAVTYLELK